MRPGESRYVEVQITSAVLHHTPNHQLRDFALCPAPTRWASKVRVKVWQYSADLSTSQSTTLSHPYVLYSTKPHCLRMGTCDAESATRPHNQYTSTATAPTRYKFAGTQRKALCPQIVYCRQSIYASQDAADAILPFRYRSNPTYDAVAAFSGVLPHACLRTYLSVVAQRFHNLYSPLVPAQYVESRSLLRSPSAGLRTTSNRDLYNKCQWSALWFSPDGCRLRHCSTTW